MLNSEDSYSAESVSFCQEDSIVLLVCYLGVKIYIIILLNKFEYI